MKKLFVLFAVIMTACADSKSEPTNEQKAEKLIKETLGYNYHFDQDGKLECYNGAL